MKTFALLFAWTLVILAYYPCGNALNAPIFWTLALIGAGIEIGGSLRAYHSLRSLEAINSDFQVKYRRAFNANDLAAARQELRAYELFLNRGAA